MKEYKPGRRLELAVYGKGGIGKSTISANLSAALALRGQKVLQIGCDPKHDSTRLLLGSRKIPTVLDYLKDVPADAAEVSAILFEGWHSIGCIEAGGPKPGVGCAGRGIISAFEFLNRHKIKDEYDTIIYDVLGDVVCGGFAVPIRREYANTVVLVTSGEFMAIYAANNILRGIQNYDGNQYKRVVGIIYNARNVAGGEKRVERFAEAVGLPILARIPRSHAFACAEGKNVPLAELEGYQEEKQIFAGLAGRLAGDPALFCACPLSDEDLEAAVLGGVSGADENKDTAAGRAQTDRSAGIALSDFPGPGETRDFSSDTAEKVISADAFKPARRPPLYGCAFNGAATTAVNLTDAIVIAHSPKACAFYTWQNISSPGRKGLFNRGILLPSAVCPHFSCTEISDNEAVYGGTDKLREMVSQAVSKKPGAVIVISSCVSGIIGDDILSVEELSTDDVPVIAIPADGDIAGDYMEGIRMCLHALAKRLISPDAKRMERTVNLVGEATVSINLENNFQTLKELLARLGIGIGCRFPGGSSVEELKNFMAAPINILASENADNLALKKWFTDEFGCTFMEDPVPVGFEDTVRFVEKIAELFGCADRVPAILEDEQNRYKKSIASLRPVLAGRRLLITTISTGMDWLFSAALDAGMEIVWVGVADYLHQGMIVSKNPEILKVSEFFFDLQTAENRIRERKPDIVVSNYTSAFSKGDYMLDVLPMTDRIGFSSGIYTLERWAAEFEHRSEGEWADDRKYYQKYFS